ncbi:hypothetical protein LEP1GSC115_4861 [Leptospira interrogans serovar Australis str. 200703203]|uniref:Uncharacterized protein n=1 Tax=Leptospira interrogans serovar Australis str. 200703203 TaxID=1085541 RepID=N1ULC3_LEPIR|nr:hypothetical protein LEP1GSC115_4861 [Leptospira interrogans serovar Australis str. 200703203]
MIGWTVSSQIQRLRDSKKTLKLVGGYHISLLSNEVRRHSKRLFSWSFQALENIEEQKAIQSLKF